MPEPSLSATSYQLSAIETKLAAEIAQLLDEKKVDVFFGFKKAESPLHPQPAFFTDSSQLSDMVYNGLCQNNLATFIPRYPLGTRIGLVVRGCENRSVNHLIVEKQHARENIFMVGIPCAGLVDWHKVVDAFGEEMTAVTETDNEVVINFRDRQVLTPREQLLHDSCLRCVHPNPLTADITIGEPKPEGDPSIARQAVEQFSSLYNSEKLAWFRKEAERCIRCYACREACPMCYCTECFVDHTEPRWTESTVSPAGMQAWHIVRAFHQSGRCVSCGACERACPMDIKMTYLTDKLNENMLAKYQFECGMDDTTQPPFAAFNLDDKKRFTL